jgi:hypothetical protein
MERQYISAEKIADKTFADFLRSTCAAKSERAVVTQMWHEVREAICSDKLVARHLTFAEFHEQHLHLVSSFSFVGESDPLRQVELENKGINADIENPSHEKM